MKSFQIHSVLRQKGSHSHRDHSFAPMPPQHTVHPVLKIEKLEDHIGGAVSEQCIEFIAQFAGRDE